MVPLVLHVLWKLASSQPSPFEPLFFISYFIPESLSDDPRYAKGYLDLVFIFYHVIVFSFIRQFLLLKISRPFATWIGLKRNKFDRFGEQVYAVAYYGTMAIWGLVRRHSMAYGLTLMVCSISCGRFLHGGTKRRTSG